MLAILGDTSTGKSCLSAMLTGRCRAPIPAAHFIKHSDQETSDPETVVREQCLGLHLLPSQMLLVKAFQSEVRRRPCAGSLAYQLAFRVPVLRDPILKAARDMKRAGGAIGQASCLEVVSEILLENPLRSVSWSAAHPLVLLVDGLDEADNPSELINWARMISLRLPPFARLIVTSRIHDSKGRDLSAQLRAFHTIELGAGSRFEREQRDDMRVRVAMHHPRINVWFPQVATPCFVLASIAAGGRESSAEIVAPSAQLGCRGRRTCHEEG